MPPKDPYIGEVAHYPGYWRDLDNTRMYPYDVDVNCPTCNPPKTNMPEEHYTGEIWGGYLYDLYRVLKGKAPWYVGNGYYYFDPAGGWRDGLPDFFDAIWAQQLGEFDATGKLTNTIKAWGSMASRGINAWLRAPYSNASDYFYTGNPGSDSSPSSPIYFSFPPYKTIKTTGNTLLSWRHHEYPIEVNTAGLTLTVTVTAKAGGAVNPHIKLFNGAGVAQTGWIQPTTTTKAVLTYPLPTAGLYVIIVSTNNTARARGYYDISITVK